MTIELDSTLAQAEVLFISFTQLIADIDRRRAENDPLPTEANDQILLRQRRASASGTSSGDNANDASKASGSSTGRRAAVALPTVSPNLRELLEAR